MSILVIGGMGFIGSRIAKMLMDQGEEVVVMGRRPTLHRLTEVADRVKAVKADKANIEEIIDLIRVHRVKKVVDVSYELEGESEQAPYSASKLNLLGTLNVFEACRIMGVRRIVWASSMAVYGDKRRAQGIPQDEESMNHPITVYGICKTHGEFMAKLYNARWDMDVVCLRPGGVYGPLRASGLTSWLTDMVKLPLAGQPVNVPPGPEETMNLSFVDDCAAAFVTCCQHPGDRLPHSVYNLGGYRATVRELIEEVKKHIPEARAHFMGKYVYYLDTVDNRRLQQDTGFQHQYDLAAGVAVQVARQRALDEAEKSKQIR